MVNQTVYLVRGMCGEWEESYDWFAKSKDGTLCFPTWDAAQVHCTQLNLLVEKTLNTCLPYVNCQAIKRQLKELDCDFDDFDTVYEVYELKLVTTPNV